MKYGAELRVSLAGTAAVNRVRLVNIATCYNDRTEMLPWNERLVVKFFMTLQRLIQMQADTG